MAVVLVLHNIMRLAMCCLHMHYSASQMIHRVGPAVNRVMVTDKRHVSTSSRLQEYKQSSRV